MENNFPVGMIVNATEVSALRILFPNITFASLTSGNGFQAYATSDGEREMIWQVLRHRNSVIRPLIEPAARFPILDTPATLPACTTCGAPDALHYGSNDPQCLPCHTHDLRLDVAHSQLADLLKVKLKPWLKHWRTKLTREELVLLIEEAVSSADPCEQTDSVVNK